MKIVITIEDVGDGTSGVVKLDIKPKIHVMQKMAQNGDATSAVAYAGLVIKKLYEVIPHDQAIKLQQDNKTPFADATKIQNNRSQIKDSILTGSKTGFKKTETGLIVPK